MKKEEIDQICSVVSAGMRQVADSIYPSGVFPGSDPGGGHVASLTEAVMGNTAGLFAIAEALDNVAQAIRDFSDDSNE